MSEILTHSALSTFRACPRKYHLRYGLGLRANTDSEPRRFGSAFHKLVEENGTADAAVLIEDPYFCAGLFAVYEAYAWRYNLRLDGFGPEVVAVEKEFDLPLVNPETGRPSTVYRLAGKIDRIVRLPDGRLALMEMKTTSQDFSPGAVYWQRLQLDQQLSIYVIAARSLGFPIDTILYDVVRRPALRPYLATPAENRKYTGAGKLYANQRELDETSVEYGDRIYGDVMSRPDHYFARIEIPRLEQDLRDCQAEVWQQQQTLRSCYRGKSWYRNPGSCFSMNMQCEYLPVCLNRDLDVQTPNGFVRDLNVHPELSGIATGEG